LKSRAIWLRVRDENTKFFQNYAKGRKKSNTIWSLKTKYGKQANSFEELSLMGRSHFKNLFKAPSEVSLAEVIQTTQTFSRYVDEEDTEELMGEVSRGELEGIIKSMPKDKSLGLDSWTMELFQE